MGKQKESADAPKIEVSNIMEAIKSIQCAREFIGDIASERVAKQLSISSLSSIAKDLSNIEARLRAYA